MTSAPPKVFMFGSPENAVESAPSVKVGNAPLTPAPSPKTHRPDSKPTTTTDHAASTVLDSTSGSLVVADPSSAAQTGTTENVDLPPPPKVAVDLTHPTTVASSPLDSTSADSARSTVVLAHDDSKLVPPASADEAKADTAPVSVFVASPKPADRSGQGVVKAHVAGPLLGLTVFDRKAHEPVASILTEVDEPFEVKPNQVFRRIWLDTVCFHSCAFRISDRQQIRNTDPDVEHALYLRLKGLPRAPHTFETTDVCDAFHFLSADVRQAGSQPGILIVCPKMQAVLKGLHLRRVETFMRHVERSLPSFACISEPGFPNDSAIGPSSIIEIALVYGRRRGTPSKSQSTPPSAPSVRLTGSPQHPTKILRRAGGLDMATFVKKLTTAGYTLSAAYDLHRPSLDSIDSCDVPVTGYWSFILPYAISTLIDTVSATGLNPVEVARKQSACERYLVPSVALTLAAFIYTPVSLQSLWNAIKREVRLFDPHPRSEHWVHNARLSADGLWLLVDPSTFTLASYLCDFATPTMGCHFNFVDHILAKHRKFEWYDAAEERMALESRRMRRRNGPPQDHCFFGLDKPPFAQPPFDELRTRYRLGDPDTLPIWK